jgi:inorganic pyrophosphatase
VANGDNDRVMSQTRISCVAVARPRLEANRKKAFCEALFAGSHYLTLERTEIMNLDRVDSGRDVPNDVNVVIEIPMNGDPIKYELDKATGALFIDRFMSTAMHYPCNYGYIPHTLSDDGDPVDVLVITPYPLIPGVVVRCRPLGVLKMTDEAGGDEKLLAVPIDKLTPIYKDIKSHKDLPAVQLNQIAHFFEHYKDLEPKKWVKVEGWFGVADAKKAIQDGVKRYASAKKKPAF